MLLINFLVTLNCLFVDCYDPITCANISPNGEEIVFGSLDHSGYAFHKDAQNVLDYCLLGHRDKLTGIDFIDQNHVVTTSYDQTVKIWSLDI